MTETEQLVNRLRKRLDSCRGDWPGIANVSGVSHSTISRFVRASGSNLTVKTMENLEAALVQFEGENTKAA